MATHYNHATASNALWKGLHLINTHLIVMNGTMATSTELEKKNMTTFVDSRNNLVIIEKIMLYEAVEDEEAERNYYRKIRDISAAATTVYAKYTYHQTCPFDVAKDVRS